MSLQTPTDYDIEFEMPEPKEPTIFELRQAAKECGVNLDNLNGELGTNQLNTAEIYELGIKIS